MLIPYETEELIRSMLDDGLTDRHVASVAGVSHTTVLRSRRAMGIIRSIPEHSIKQTRLLLIDGLGTKDIAERVRVTPGVVRAVRRYYYLYRKLSVVSAKPCPMCGHHLQPAAEGNPEEIKQPNLPAHLSADAALLYHIVNDLVALDSLQLITHKLFYRLACRARESLREINGKSPSNR